MIFVARLQGYLAARTGSHPLKYDCPIYPLKLPNVAKKRQKAKTVLAPGGDGCSPRNQEDFSPGGVD